MADKVLGLIKSTRPKQWLKNLGVFTAITFSGQLFNQLFLVKTLWAFFIFCGLSSATYLLNDVVDLNRDRAHPLKRHRPIAEGLVSPQLALSTAIILVGLPLLVGLLLPTTFFLTCLAFLLLQLSYTLILKQIVLLDIFAIAGGYILRVMAGEFATGWHISVWLLLCIISLSLFLAIGKRRAELTSLQSLGPKTAVLTRETLSHYSEKLLDVYTAMFANATWITYAFFTFFERPPRKLSPIVVEFLLEFFPWGLTRKWMMTTIPLVMYGIMRYMQLIYEKQRGEAPEIVLLSDRPLMITIVLWGAMTLGIIYVIGA